MILQEEKDKTLKTPVTTSENKKKGGGYWLAPVY